MLKKTEKDFLKYKLELLVKKFHCFGQKFSKNKAQQIRVKNVSIQFHEIQYSTVFLS